MNWRLRKPDGTIYGPVAFPEFYRWATEGRILPDDFVSEGDGEWIPAPDVAALELDWILPRGEGQQLGPLHVLAFAELLHQRMLQGGESIIKKSGGDPVPVGQAVAGELLQRMQGTLHELAAARVELRTIRRALAQREPPPVPAAPPAELDASRRRTEELLARATALETELDALRSTQAATRTELERLRVMAQEQKEALDAAHVELTRAREAAARAEDRARKLEEAAQALEEGPRIHPLRPDKMNAEGREKEFQDLTRRYERLLARTREEAERNDKIQKALEAERAASAERQAEMEARLRTAQEQIAALKAHVEEQERLHQELVRNFRDLNDRYIRLRADKEPSTESPSSKPKVRLV